MSYRTDHYNGYLFQNRRVLNDLSLRNAGQDTVQIAAPLTVAEKRNPREYDRRYSERLLSHLNEHVEYYHRAIWTAMDPNRRFLLLDGFIFLIVSIKALKPVGRMKRHSFRKHRHIKKA